MQIESALRGIEERLAALREVLVDISHASENPDAAPGHFGFLARRALGADADAEHSFSGS